MQAIRSLVFILAMYALMAVMGLLCAPLAAWSRNGAYWSIKAYVRIVLAMLRIICGLRCEVRGPVPEGEVIVASKHQSFLDILILVDALPRPRFVMKKELRWAPILGLYAMRIGSTPVARGKRATAMRDMVSHAQAQAADPSQLVIYPQGTRVAPGAYLPYKIGAGVLYERFGVPCVPSATNVGLFWPKRGIVRRPGTAVIAFGEALPPGLEIKTFMARLERDVETRSNALMVEGGMDPARLPEPRLPADDRA